MRCGIIGLIAPCNLPVHIILQIDIVETEEGWILHRSFEPPGIYSREARKMPNKAGVRMHATHSSPSSVSCSWYHIHLIDTVNFLGEFEIEVGIYHTEEKNLVLRELIL